MVREVLIKDMAIWNRDKVTSDDFDQTSLRYLNLVSQVTLDSINKSANTVLSKLTSTKLSLTESLKKV